MSRMLDPLVEMFVLGFDNGKAWVKPFVDELIIMIKNNPTPITIPLKCLGSQPVIEIKEGSPMKFTRILLNQTIKRQLKLQNTSAIPIKFRL